MSRERCGRCGVVFSTTYSPNAQEGYFISDEDIDYGAQELLEKDLEDGGPPYLRGALKKHGIRATKCPECGFLEERTTEPAGKGT